MNFSYNFPAIRGIQASKYYYTINCPLRLIPKIFLFDEEEVPPEHRSQRIMNRSRIPEITNYILENPSDYVFSSLTASVDGDLQFEPLSDQYNDIGRLFISLDARFLINDGQHRRAAIEEAIKVNPDIGEETVSVVFFPDQGLIRSQQIFADLNRHAVNTTTSLGILYDHRDQLARITKRIIKDTPFLERYTDKEKVSLSKNSPKLFALNQIFNTNFRLLGKRKGESITQQEEELLFQFWQALNSSIPDWIKIQERKISPRELRMASIAAHGVFLEALGVVGNHLIKHFPNSWVEYIKRLDSIDFDRENHNWAGRAYGITGRINKTGETIQLTANQIKKYLDLQLSEIEKDTELRFLEGGKNVN